MVEEVKMLKEFQKAFDCIVNEVPTIPDKSKALLCIKLCVSEVSELTEAIANEDIVEVFDALLDSIYVLLYTANTFGMGDLLKEGFTQVHKNNMSKLGPDGKPIKDASGKIQKPANYKPVDLSWVREVVERRCFGEPVRESGACEKCPINRTCVDKMMIILNG